MRLLTFDYFRAVAILIIVFGHSYGQWSIDSFSERVLANIITGGTSLFVFISGFFFHYIFYKNFNYIKFLKNKISFVLIPYIIFTSMGVLYYRSSLSFPDIQSPEGLYSWIDNLKEISTNLWTGSIATPYWYVPFILIVFILSPLFMKYIELPKISRNIIFLILLIISMMVHRPLSNLSPIHSLLYFTPVYLLGIICSIHREYVFKFIENKTIMIGSIVLLLSTAQALIHNGYGNYHKADIFSYNEIDIIILQKIALCFFFLSLLQKYKDRKIPALELLASSSFAIFFIHPWVIILLSKSGMITFLNFLPGFFVFISTAIMTVIISLVIALTIKLGLKRYSRFAIGW